MLLPNLLLLACIASNLHSGATTHRRHTPDIESKTIRCGAYKFKVWLKAVPPTEDAGTWGKGARTEGNQVILNLVASVDGSDEVLIPKSAFLDLQDPNEFKAVRTRHGCKLVVDGGDAGSSYSAVIEVRDGAVVRRTVRDGEFPQAHYEQTIYRQIQDGDVD